MGEEALEKSLVIKSSLGDTIGLGRTYNNLMQLYRIQRLETEAAEVARKAIKCFEEVGDYYDMGVATRNLGRLYRSLKKKKEAQEHFVKALNLFEQAQAPGEVLALTEELNMLASPRDKKMPWWAWVLYGAPILTFLVLIILLVIGINAADTLAIP
jgi:tetratricopeptide (TPR) repeat protein